MSIMAYRAGQPDQGQTLDVERPAPVQRTCLLVLGMYRSGLNALSGVLARLGAELPKRLSPPGADFPAKGESQALTHFNDRLLASAGTGWDHIRPVSSEWLQSAKRGAAAKLLRGLIRSEFADSPHFVITDPRISRLSPLWLEQIEACGAQPHVILMLRNPLEVAASIGAKEQSSRTMSLLLWLEHVLSAEADTRGWPRSFVNYADLLHDWPRIADRLEHEINRRWPVRPERAITEVSQFLLPELYRHRIPEEEILLRDDVPAWVKTAYPILKAISEGKGASREALRALDDLREKLHAATGPLFALEGELKRSAEQWAERQAELVADAEARDQEMDAAHRAQAIELHRLQVELDSLKTSLSGRLARALRCSGRLLPRFSRSVREAAAILWWTATLQRARVTRHMNQYRQAAKIRAAGLLDQTWYLAKHPDVAAAGFDPVLHYLRFGAAEGRNPSPSFDTRAYHFAHPEVAAAGENPLSHYLRHGAKEGRPPPSPSDGSDALLRGRATSNDFAAVHYERWNQSQGTGNVDVYGALSARPVVAARSPAKLIAYYLPQFHPIPENDAWWGRGFTEWRNVAKAIPQFVGHQQPKLPGELGFYDLRVPEVQRRQVELARHYGISAFCFHFYWFGGKRLLEMPLLSFLENKDLDLSFCLCWANENWTRRWDGAEDEILIAQDHSAEDDIAFIRYLRKYFDDPRYLKIDGKPVLTVYRPGVLPDARATCERWRAEAEAMGLPGLYLIATNSFRFWEYDKMGFDALSEFPPHSLALGSARHTVRLLMPQHSGGIFSYEETVESQANKSGGDRKIWPGVMTGWDNTARRSLHGHIFHGATPKLFHRWLTGAIQRACANPPAERFVMINAWNEWAEGAYLEPDRHFGYAYLAACGSAIAESSPPDEHAMSFLADRRALFRPRVRHAVALHLFYEDLAPEFARRFKEFGDLDLYITVADDLSLEKAHELYEQFPEAYIEAVPNRGRDMLPFVRLFPAIRKGKHEFVCKLHTKRSAHLRDGAEWRDELVTSLLSPGAKRLLAADNPRLGLLVSNGALAGLQDEFVRRHSANRVRLLGHKLGVNVTFDETFVAGSMFWFRPEALEKFATLTTPDEFEPELGQIDGTLAHVLERLTVIASRAAGFEVAEIREGALKPRQY
jgi:lipopolysaccharide biosynthesis protein